MHTNVKTALGIFLFFFFGFLTLWDISGNYSSSFKKIDDLVTQLSFFNPELVALVFMPLLVATGWRVWSGESHWSSVWFNAGVPLGVIASSISLVNLLMINLGLEQARMYIGESLLAIFYGGIVSFIGYINLDNVYKQRKHRRQPNIGKAFVLLLIYSLLGVSLHFSGGLSAFIYLPAITIIAAAVSAFLLINRDDSKSVCQLTCEAMVMASLASVMIAVISYNFYQGTLQLTIPAIVLGILGPLYCSFCIFLCATFYSDKDLRATNFGRINWHLLEIYSLWILMCLAPKSLLEMGIG
jgi:hypothetical protein